MILPTCITTGLKMLVHAGEPYILEGIKKLADKLTSLHSKFGVKIKQK